MENIRWKDRKGIFLISFLFLMVIFHNVFNRSFQHWDVSIALILMFVFALYKKESLKLNLPLIVFCSSSFVLVTLNYHVLSRLDDIPVDLYRSYKHLINQYFWILVFITLPTVYYFNRFNERHFSFLIYLILFFLFFYLFYLGLILNFDRGLFTVFFDPVISYDITFISISLLGLSFSFFQKGRWGYIGLILSTFTIFLLILHGSRGTWVGLPFALIILSLFYYRSELRKTLLMLVMFGLFIVTNLIVPSSPVLDRMQAFKEDTQHIDQNNYSNSSGIRLFLWANSIELFKASPVIGVGVAQIEVENCKLHQQGQLPTCFQHQHSIYFHELAANGTLGVAALILTFLSSLGFFLSHLITKDRYVKGLAITGIIFVIYYIMSGLTEYYLFFKNTTYIFYWITASLISFILIHKVKNAE